MSFHSLAFLIFAPIVFLGHALLRGRALRVWLLVMSYIFYGWGRPWHCLIMLASTVLNFFTAQHIEASRSRSRKQAWLAASVIGNLALLGFFKYTAFAARVLNKVSTTFEWGVGWPIPDISLPIGISFYTFQALSYTVDVYRAALPACRSFITMGLYIAFFPQLVAGPIERATRLMPQIEQKQPVSPQDRLAGLSRILWGLAKKVIFADWLALFVNEAYGHPGTMSATELWLATYAFAFQIYLDFSAYSDIAIGLARAMGIELMENFRWPYLARSISEFWQRWHISLSTWLRDYLYIPLGGSRRGALRTLANVFIVMALGGLWHGAAPTFLAWGLWIALGLAMFHAYAGLRRGKAADERPAGRRDIPAILVTFHWILLSWVLFRAESLDDAQLILGRLFRPWVFDSPGMATELTVRTVIIVALVALAHALRGRLFAWDWRQMHSPVAAGLLWGGLIVAMALLFAPAQEPFIYFQF